MTTYDMGAIYSIAGAPANGGDLADAQIVPKTLRQNGSFSQTCSAVILTERALGPTESLPEQRIGAGMGHVLQDVSP
jgi:hypothetical protein